MPEPLVLIPGMMCDARLYWPQIVAFSADRSVHVAPLVGGSISAMAQNILLGAPKRFSVLGLSMGGIVAMEMMNKDPGRISRAVLMDTNPLPETPQNAAEREPQIIGVRNGRLIEVMRDMMKPAYLAPGPQRMDVLSLMMDMAEAMGPECFVNQSRALQRRPDQQRTLSQTQIPTLVACGEHDTLCPLKRHEMMAELIPNSVLHIFRDAGHLPTLEQPMAVNEALRAFLDQPLVLR
ncbi:alpha/beta fold hydrolase [Alphaproteobacteria bacterium KMM 3653]|uniref:Alpha/beta fold hydrolase n=1 Tax=Harenicola maris TaxID=2841044 RepID=A0AAP2G9M3_9RHOB|nr:alpha/beta fold hydrolase [Harenicola maris]